MSRYKQAAVGLLCLLVFVGGCTTIIVVSGSTYLEIGDIATYTLQLGWDDYGGFGAVGPAVPYLVADVPQGWTLIEGTYMGTHQGTPVSGDCTAVPEDPGFCELPGPVAGFQRIWLTGLGSQYFHTGDTFEVVLDFAVNDLPAGGFVLRFWNLADPESSLYGNGCGTPAASIRVNSGPSRLLRYVSSLIDGIGGVSGLGSPGRPVLSNDGKHLYVGDHQEGAITVFSRSSTGEPVFIDTVTEPLLASPGAVTLSQDDRHLYVASRETSHSAILRFLRDEAAGMLVFEEAITEGVSGDQGNLFNMRLCLGPEGNHLYLTGQLASTQVLDSIVVYQRDPMTGGLSFLEVHTESEVDALADPIDIIVSPDGRHLYVLGNEDDTIAIFDRDTQTGLLSYHGVVQNGSEGVVGMEDPHRFTFSPDGGNIYALGRTTDSIVVFTRDQDTGELSYLSTLRDGEAGMIGTHRPAGVAVSPDGRHVLVTSNDGLALFARDESTGQLVFRETLLANGIEALNMEVPLAAVIAPDNRNVFVTSANSDSLSLLLLPVFSDDFETGDTIKWAVSLGL